MQVTFGSVVRCLREKKKLCAVGGYRYDMRHIVMSLNNSCVDFIKQEFQFNDHRLDLLRFVWLMRQALDQDPNDHFVCYEIVKLFEQIDIDNSRTIEWAEFLQYLSQSNWLSAPPAVRPANARDGSLLVHAFHEQAKYRKHLLRRVVELARHNSLALLANNHALSFLSLDRAAEPKPAFSLSHVDCSRVLALDYAEEQRLFGVLLTNRNLVFVEDGEMQKVLGVVRSSGNQVDIRYLPLHRLWVVETVSSGLQVFASPKGGELQNRVVFKPHEQPLTAVREVGWPLTLCTASLDGLLKLWQVASGRLVIELDVGKERGQTERKGVKGVATYNRAGVAYLCTWMFTSEIFLWLPSLSLSKPFAGELQGHLGLVTDCVFAWRGELVSLDDKRAVRVWNPQKLQCIQHFTIPDEGCSLLVLRSQPYLLTYSRLLDFYRLRTNSKADLQSEVGAAGKDGRNVLALDGNTGKLLAVEFSPYYCFLVVLTSQEVKIFDVNGHLSVAGMRPPSSYEFLAMAMKGSRRVCLATSAGTVQERKVEDGQLLRSFAVCDDPESEDLKFLLYQEETKILLGVVEGEEMSHIVTFELCGEEAVRVKQIQFEQVGLLQLKRLPNGHQFFILSADACVTVWEYDKLIILNRVDLRACLPHILTSHIELIVEPHNHCLMVQSGRGIGVLFLDSAASVREAVNLQLPQGTQLVAAALLLQKIPRSFLEEQKLKRTKREMQFEAKKKVDFHMFDKEADAHSAPDTFEELFILAAACKKGEVYYYKLDQLLTQTSAIEDSAVLRGKAQHVRQHRRAHMRPFLWSGKNSSFDLTQHKFTEQYSFISNVEAAGSALGLFYFHTAQNHLLFVTPYAQLRAEWALSLPKPKLWGIAYNELDEVLARLDRTAAVLEQINQAPLARFKIDFLINKYLTAEEVEQLARAEERAKKEAVKSTAFFSRKEVGSRKSIVSINQKLCEDEKEREGSAGRAKAEVNAAFRKQSDNIFQKKLQEQQRRRVMNRNSKQLFQKVQRSLSYSKLHQRPPPAQTATNTQSINHQVAQKSMLASQMDALLASALKQSETHLLLLEQSSVKSAEKQAKMGLNSILQRPQSNAQFRTRSGLKSRIKSSLGELSKNFTAGKIEWQNFRRGLGEGLTKKGKLKL